MKKIFIALFILFISLSIKADNFDEIQGNYHRLSEVANLLQEKNKDYKIDHGEYSDNTFILALERYIDFEPTPDIFNISPPSITKNNYVIFKGLITDNNFQLCKKMNYVAFDFIEVARATKCEVYNKRYVYYFF